MSRIGQPSTEGGSPGCLGGTPDQFEAFGLGEGSRNGLGALGERSARVAHPQSRALIGGLGVTSGAQSNAQLALVALDLCLSWRSPVNGWRLSGQFALNPGLCNHEAPSLEQQRSPLHCQLPSVRRRPSTCHLVHTLVTSSYLEQAQALEGHVQLMAMQGVTCCWWVPFRTKGEACRITKFLLNDQQLLSANHRHGLMLLC